MNATNSTTAGNVNGMSPAPVSSQSALWGVITLALNAMLQPSTLEGKNSSGFASWTRASPLVCLLDVLAAVINVSAHRYNNHTWRDAAQRYMTDFKLDSRGSEGVGTASIAGALFFALGVVPQALKIFSMQGEGVVVTQMICGCYFVAALLSNLLNMLSSSSIRNSEVSASPQGSRIADTPKEWNYDDESFPLLGLFIGPSVFGFMMVPVILCMLKGEEHVSGRFFNRKEPFSYGTFSFLGLSLTAIILRIIAIAALNRFTIDKRLYRSIANVQFAGYIMGGIAYWTFVTLMFSIFCIFSGGIVAIFMKDPWALISTPMFVIHWMCWMGVGIGFPLVFSFCFVVFTEILQQWLGDSHNGTGELECNEAGADDKMYILKALGRYICPIFGILHLVYFAIVYLIAWNGAGTTKPGWTEFLG